MKSSYRYCKTCGKEILHDHTTDDSRDFFGGERVFIGLVTLGVSEIIRRNVYKCQKCGKETKRK